MVPSPRAPINEAMTTMERDIITHWFMPITKYGSASGSFTVLQPHPRRAKCLCGLDDLRIRFLNAKGDVPGQRRKCEDDRREDAGSRPDAEEEDAWDEIHERWRRLHIVEYRSDDARGERQFRQQDSERNSEHSRHAHRDQNEGDSLGGVIPQTEVPYHEQAGGDRYC